MVDLEVQPAFRRGLLDPRGRTRGSALPEVPVSDARLDRAPRGVAHRSTAAAGARGLRGAGARHPRLRPQERLLRRAHRPVRGHRLVAGRSDRGRRAGARTGRRRAHAFTVLERRQHHRCRAPGNQPRHPHRHRPDRGRPHGVPRSARPDLRGHRAGPGGGEPPGAHPRHHPHDDVEQVRLARAHHGQQERDGDRVLHALRRHGRRLLRHQGRPEDAGVRAVAATATTARTGW